MVAALGGDPYGPAGREQAADRVMGVRMKKVFAVAACGFALTACSSSWMPSFDLSMPSFGGGGASTTTLAVESDPPGANASVGAVACRTPCRLTVPTTGPFAVNIALDGFIAQSVPVRIVAPDDPRLGAGEEAASGAVRLEPNPLYVELERAPPTAPPPVQKKKKKAPTTAARRTAPPATATQAPAQNQGAPTTAVAPQNQAPPMQQQQGFPPPQNNNSAPWPMPR